MKAMTNFFITGLPRSRTAWLANLFTTGAQVCHHDLLGKVDSLAEFELKLRAAAVAGDADSGLVWIFPKLRELYPAARWLLIERDPADSVASIQRVSDGTPWAQAVSAYTDTLDLWLPQYLELTELMVKDSRVARLPYAALDDFESVAAAWRFLLPQQPRLARARFEFLHPLKVEVVPGKAPLQVAARLIEEIKQTRTARIDTKDLCRLPQE